MLENRSVPWINLGYQPLTTDHYPSWESHVLIVFFEKPGCFTPTRGRERLGTQRLRCAGGPERMWV